jgi:hypothetical protein
MSKRYLVSNLFGLRNQYGIGNTQYPLLIKKMAQFLKQRKKPENPPFDAILVLRGYTTLISHLLG